ncbi:hypothetical protein D3C71_1515710 [compost metagenome]
MPLVQRGVHQRDDISVGHQQSFHLEALEQLLLRFLSAHSVGRGQQRVMNMEIKSACRISLLPKPFLGISQQHVKIGQHLQGETVIHFMQLQILAA